MTSLNTAGRSNARERIRLQASRTTVAPRRILVPVDGSENSKRAARVAIDLAKSYEAALIVISVVVAPSFYVAGPVAAPADLTDYYRLEMEDANNAVSSIGKLAKDGGVDASSQVLRPDKPVVEAIADFATTDAIDLIVVGTRGLGGFKKMLLGSVSSGLVSNAPCTVLVVR